MLNGDDLTLYRAAILVHSHGYNADELRAYPRESRMVCGDGLERLGEDVVPLAWRDEGILGLLRLFQ